MGLELNEYGMQQRRIAYMRFLGELYSYRLIDSPVIFDTLYLIIGHGHGTPEVNSSVPNSVPFLSSSLKDFMMWYPLL